MNQSATAPVFPRPSELRDLTRLTAWQRARAIAWPCLAFLVYWPLAFGGWWVPATLALVAFSFLTYGWTSHDLVHGNLGLPRRANCLLLSILEAAALRSGHAYQAAHLHHHARFPHDDDIEGRAAHLPLVAALFEGLVFNARIYFWALAHAPARRGWIVAEGVAIAALIAGAIVVLPFTVAPAAYVALMIAGSWTIPLVTSYIPHDASATDRLHQTRLFRGWFVRVIALDHLYHLEHHLYPQVPHQNWPRLALRLDPCFAAANLQTVRLE
jgi:beta-carotene hydroxylase